MPVDWDNIRKEEFPALNNFTYLMAASASPISKTACQIGKDYYDDMHYHGDINHEHFFENLEEIRGLIAEYIRADPENIAFMINTSSAITVIAHLLNDQQAEVLYPSMEFPASIHVFKKLGFPCKKIDDLHYKYPILIFRENLSKNTKYIVHSHVQSFNGFRQNLKKLGEFCRKDGLINIINATQSFGAFNIDVQDHEIDFLVSNALKWIGCGYGIGILYIKKCHLEERDLPFTSWLSVNDPFSMDNENLNIIHETNSMDSFGGCPNFAALLPLMGGLELIKNKIGQGNIKTGITRIEERIKDLTSEFLKEIQDYNFDLITPTELDYRSGIITIKTNLAERIHGHLLQNKIYTSLKKYPKEDKNTLIRFAFNFYNNYYDIEQVAKSLNGFKR